ncbi:LacI family DNA-binding transcriptional regulator [Rathayibacter sp. PhB185]|uniref:LacI family DNA-binding transcriptional regulator n=1 Tax=Rathayibacter sp. PhB185 TaxID=2485198 RepID=UPI000F4C7DEB|nr:LacI family DNA-binding transcriptional regulator [Rathayibacter sp. PhB185]ROP49084.1 LacI family transcriptional regulator [Rathayibacter sp. PhB186]ROS50799.1 LacI family transcriptional regulator [Rathayibacter sp. PhB185]
MRGAGDIGVAAVARLAGVSTATVSNVINRPHLVSDDTQAKVRAAIDELDFVPNRAAATLRTGSSRLIGLVIPDVVNPFYAAIVDAVVEAADRERYAVSLCVSHEDPDKELRHFDILAEHRAAGALVVPVTADPSRLSQLQVVGARLILVDRKADESTMCSVSTDDVLGGQLAIEHLLTQPGVGITLVNGSRSITQCEDRHRGAARALATADPGSALTEIEVPEMTIEEGVAVGIRIARSDLPRRVFCTNDQLAVGVLRGLASEGLHAPADVTVVGYGDLALGTEEALRLTTIGQPKQEMGRTAVLRLLEEISEGRSHRHRATVFQPGLVPRSTTRP